MHKNVILMTMAVQLAEGGAEEARELVYNHVCSARSSAISSTSSKRERSASCSTVMLATRRSAKT
ncbi:hypothetical protein E2C01_028611 [Portunus trituberculatus]|uniref:Uncharacterized protein n=1 Tax=Portunus trituberculatus TaxID=210409 RepID=A0A5B7EQG0_PORTR|nr:hypothetical protein [Portunus trituberculatus]